MESIGAFPPVLKSEGALSEHFPLAADLKVFFEPVDTITRKVVRIAPKNLGGPMALIPVERAQIGMILAEGVVDRRGRLLIPAGKEITERYLDSLPMWGVTHVEIEGEDAGSPDEGAEEAEPWAVSKAMEVVNDHFILANRSHPVMNELANLCIQRKAGEIQREGQS